MKHKNISNKIIEQIDKCIPYPILFLLIYENEISTAISYKKRNLLDSNKYVVDSSYFSDWKNIDDYKYELPTGLNLQTIYEKMVKLLIGKNVNENIEVTIENQKYNNQLKNEIILLESKIKKEKHFNRKVKMNIELQNKKKKYLKIND